MDHGGVNQRNTALRILLGTLGGLAMIAGLALAAAVVVDLFARRDDTDTGGSIGALILFVAVAVGGFLVARANLSPRRRVETLEARVLALAETLGGELTVDVTAAHCGLGVVETKAILDKLVVENGAQLQISPDGVLVYSFPGLRTRRADQPAAPS